MSNTSERSFVHKWYRSNAARLTVRIAVYTAVWIINWCVFYLFMLCILLTHDFYRSLGYTTGGQSDLATFTLNEFNVRIEMLLSFGFIALSLIVILLKRVATSKPRPSYDSPSVVIFRNPMRALGKWVSEYKLDSYEHDAETRKEFSSDSDFPPPSTPPTTQ